MSAHFDSFIEVLYTGYYYIQKGDIEIPHLRQKLPFNIT
jgi:hypothetical protein